MAKMQNTLAMESGIDNKDGMVNVLSSGKNSNGIPYGQSPGIGEGDRDTSMNSLPSNAAVVYSASSNLMTGMSMARGPGGK